MSSQHSRLTIIALLVAAAPAAWAAPGAGIRLGGSDGRLHPFIELEGRYDSSVMIDVGGKALEDFVFHVRPGVQLKVPGELTAVDLTARLDWAQYMGVGDPVTKDLSNLYAMADLGVGFNRKGAVSLELGDTFIRSDQPQALSFGTGVISNYNLFEVRVPWRPGGGALTLNANGAWALETFELLSTTDCGQADPDPICAISKLGYSDLRVGAGAAWKFLPRTSALFDASYFKRLPSDSNVTATKDPGGYRLLAGVSGLITPHIAAMVKAGYGSSAATGQTLSTWLAAVEGEWLPTESASVKLGYAHDLAVDPAARYTTDRVYLAARQLVAGRVALALTGGFSRLGYDPGNATTTILNVTPSVGVEVTRWLRGELGYSYVEQASSTISPVLGARDYSKNVAWLKATATY